MKVYPNSLFLISFRTASPCSSRIIIYVRIKNPESFHSGFFLCIFCGWISGGG